MNSAKWHAQWLGSLLTGGARTTVPATYFRREFEAPPDVKRAMLHVTALGLYECEINGAVAGDHVLAPGWTDYSQRVYSQSHDVTSMLQPGPNALGVILGDGWYCGHTASNDRQYYGSRPQFLLQLDMERADGTVVRVLSDKQWKAAVGPLLENDLIMGEAYDARLELGDWSSPRYDDGAWQWAPAAEDPGIVIERSPGPPARRHEVLPPAGEGLTVRRTGFKHIKHICLADFGQNLSGRVRLTVSGPRGACLTIRHGEMLDEEGGLYTRNLRSARATDYYTLKGGGPETWEPRFTFHGFRYAEVSWRGAPLELHQVNAVALYSDMAPIGEFRCSDPLINRLAENIHWGLKSNFLDIPTDCPQRDERVGWTGDAQVFVRTAALHRDVRGFFHKWLQDMRDAQRPNGAIPTYCPNCRAFADIEDGGPAWADAVYICPWVLYEQYGDVDFLAEHYDAMRRHLEFLTRHRVKDGIREHPDIEGWHGYGDWLAPDGSGQREGRTPRDLIGTAYYAEAARITGSAAEILGRADEARDVRSLRDTVVKAFRGRFVTGDGLLAGGTQTAYVLALHFGLLAKALRAAAAAELVRLIRANGNRLATGFVGTPYLLHALEANGYLDVAFDLLEQKECPSWLYPVRHGATTIWERWDSWTPERGFHPHGMNSFNHYAYGSVGEWLFSTVAGIVPAAPGYRRVLFKPRPGGSLRSASASLRTPYGRVAIAWNLEGDALHIELTVPPGAEAEFSPPPDWFAAPAVLKPGTHEIVARRDA